MTDAEKLAELKEWARSFRSRCTQDVNHWEKLNENKLELKAFGMVQAMDVVMNKIEELEMKKPTDVRSINRQAEKYG